VLSGLIIGELSLLRLIKFMKATNITMIFVNEEQIWWLPFNSYFFKKGSLHVYQVLVTSRTVCNIILIISKEEICEINVLLY